MVLTTEGFLEAAIESWPEWDLRFEPTIAEFLSDALAG